MANTRRLPPRSSPARTGLCSMRLHTAYIFRDHRHASNHPDRGSRERCHLFVFDIISVSSGLRQRNERSTARAMSPCC
eukprot:2398996-Pleurochrysis_carterae.AAC.1